jgi:hypothetical protein
MKPYSSKISTIAVVENYRRAVLPDESVLVVRGQEVGIGGHELVEQAGIAPGVPGTFGIAIVAKCRAGPLASQNARNVEPWHDIARCGRKRSRYERTAFVLARGNITYLGLLLSSRRAATCADPA